jgi:cytochrome c oxidase subunit IV
MEKAIESLPTQKRAKAQQIWETIKVPTAFGAGYYSSATDAVKLGNLIRAMGGFTTKAYIKNYNGKPHIILKGAPGLRKVLVGTKYGIKNPKIIKMGVGRHAATAAARTGGYISIILITIYRIIDYFLTDNQTLFQFIGSLAVDVVKIGIMVGVSIFVCGLAFVSAFAIGPLVAVLVVGVLVGTALNLLDEELQITQRVVAALEELAAKAPTLEEIKEMANNASNNIQVAKNNFIQESKRELSKAAGRASRSVLDFVLDATKSTVVNIARNTLRKTTGNLPRLH